MDELVQKVKTVQRQAGGADLWGDFLQRRGGGKRDPALKSPEFLQAFLDEAEMAGIHRQQKPSSKTQAKGGGKGKESPAQRHAQNWNQQYLQQQMMMEMAMMMSQWMYPTQKARGKGSAPGPHQPTDLVSLVKAVQKRPGGFDLWQNFIDRKGGGKRDPTARSFGELEEFLRETDPEAARSVLGRGRGDKKKTPGGPSKIVPTSAEHAHAVARVKAFQREGGREAWLQYIERFGTTKCDPAAHSLQVLQDFLAEADPSGLTAAVPSSFDEASVLAMKVKHGQRISDDFKQAWYEYVAVHGEDVRDPTKHSAALLKAFLESTPPVDAPQQDGDHTDLVRRIKDGQRASPEFKQSWWEFCDARGQADKHDPERHDSTFLREFLFSIPEREQKAAYGEPVPTTKFINRWSPY